MSLTCFYLPGPSASHCEMLKGWERPGVDCRPGYSELLVVVECWLIIMIIMIICHHRNIVLIDVVCLLRTKFLIELLSRALPHLWALAIIFHLIIAYIQFIIDVYIPIQGPSKCNLCTFIIYSSHNRLSWVVNVLLGLSQVLWQG